MSDLGENLERNEEQKSKPPHQNNFYFNFNFIFLTSKTLTTLCLSSCTALKRSRYSIRAVTKQL